MEICKGLLKIVASSVAKFEREIENTEKIFGLCELGFVKNRQFKNKSNTSYAPPVFALKASFW